MSLNWFESNQFCKSLGGRLNLATSQGWFNKTYDMLINSEKNNPQRCLRTWMGASDEQEEGVWRDSESGKIVNISKFWYPGQPNGLRRQNCLGIWVTVSIITFSNLHNYQI